MGSGLRGVSATPGWWAGAWPLSLEARWAAVASRAPAAAVPTVGEGVALGPTVALGLCVGDRKAVCLCVHGWPRLEEAPPPPPFPAHPALQRLWQPLVI